MHKLERWLDEATEASWTNTPEEGESLRPIAEERIHQLAAMPDEAMPVLLHAFEEGEKFRVTVVCTVIRAIGYPKNAAAIPYLLYYLGDANFPGGIDVLGSLNEIEPMALLPSLIRVLLKQEPTIPYNGSERAWEFMMTGCCYYLRRCPDQTVLQHCAPAVNFALCSALSRHPDQDKGYMYLILDIIEKVGPLVYFLPALVLLAKVQNGTQLGTRSHQLVRSFAEEQQRPYRSITSDN